MKKLTRLSRRRLLQGTGLAAGTLFLPSLFGKAEAQFAPPKRIVVFETQHGPVSGRWEFRGQGLDGTDEAEWEIPLADAPQSLFRRTLEPLYEHRNDVLVLEGVSFTSALLDEPGNNHGVSNGHRFTGALEGTQRVSFEQYIAEEVAVPGRFPYLAYNTGSSDSTNGSFYDTGGNKVVTGRMRPGEGYLQRAYERVFGLLEPSDEPAGPPTARELSRMRRGETTAFLKAQYEKLYPRLGSEDRLKLERHTEMLVDLGKQVEALAQIDCDAPEVPALEGASGPAYANVLMSKFYPTAMACDLTRVAVLAHTQLDATDFGAPSGLDVHQDIAHQSTEGVAAEQMEDYYNLHAQQFADMIAAFKSVPEGNGTMLDNTVLLWMPELANGWHDMHELMVVMAGGLGGAITPGRYVKYGETGPNPEPKSDGQYGARRFGLGPAHNKLFVSLMQAFGVTRNSIGLESGVGEGYGAGLPIDLTGPISRLT